ncbi:sigma D regulator [Halopseudomonas salegens]|uniref:Regulator of RpoD, Rsd/AlgQ n=1 Tax=Halopseudomonas salegens TaxID=1434072 RepID=A0A1H2E356_9GAMM|nr:sigma D regulator [Halopseudomonas salegens]SDT89576.1 regulator of RpoD, Rsd/AlgQ [Halopseudomonas salegens]
MLESCQTAQERWGGVHQLIDRWLAERKELILHYSALRERAAPNSQPDRYRSEFCNVLVDYLSAGHFEIYSQLIREAEDFKDNRGLELIHQLYPRIEVTTQEALGFNDSYGHSADLANEQELQQELQQLGAMLDERFELEDCLIEVLHTAHQNMLTTS